MGKVHQKLQRARVMLQKRNPKKSGLNKFSGYEYFELADFLPAVMEIFDEVGLCSLVSFDEKFATLKIVDASEGESDDSAAIIITSPMSTAAIRGCHPIQNLGAVESYQRRYLYTCAMEIVEKDILDGMTETENHREIRQEEMDQRAYLPPSITLKNRYPNAMCCFCGERHIAVGEPIVTISSPPYKGKWGAEQCYKNLADAHSEISFDEIPEEGIPEEKLMDEDQRKTILALLNGREFKDRNAQKLRRDASDLLRNEKARYGQANGIIGLLSSLPVKSPVKSKER